MPIGSLATQTESPNLLALLQKRGYQASDLTAEELIYEATTLERMTIDNEIMRFRQHCIDTKSLGNSISAMLILNELQKWLKLGIHFQPR